MYLQGGLKGLQGRRGFMPLEGKPDAGLSPRVSDSHSAKAPQGRSARLFKIPSSKVFLRVCKFNSHTFLSFFGDICHPFEVGQGL